MRTRAEVAVFVTRKGGAEVLTLRRSAVQGGYWHVVAGGIETGETAKAAAERELCEETGLVALVDGAGVEVVEYVDPLTKGPGTGPVEYARPAAQVNVTCFHVTAPDDWEPALDWEHDDHRWSSPREAYKAMRWPATAEALREVLMLDAT